MDAVYKNGNVTAICPDCGVPTTFEFRRGSGEFGSIVVDHRHQFNGQQFSRILYKLLQCAGCYRGGLAKIHDNGRVLEGTLEEFIPSAVEHARIPANVPDGIVSEYRESELCASFGAWRAASALIRSTLEKTLRANGYVNGSLAARIDEAANDGVITEARRKRAHEDIRVLGNDVLHDEWREVLSDEVRAAHLYSQRILEDFYDDRASVEAILVAKGRLAAPTA